MIITLVAQEPHTKSLAAFLRQMKLGALHNHPMKELIFDKLPTSSGSTIGSSWHNGAGTSEPDYIKAKNVHTPIYAVATYQAVLPFSSDKAFDKINVYGISPKAKNENMFESLGKATVLFSNPESFIYNIIKRNTQ